MTATVRDQQLTVVGAVGYNSCSARLFTTDCHPCSEYAEEKRTEQNFIVRSSKYDAESNQ